MEEYKLTIHELIEKVNKGETNSQKIINSLTKRIQDTDSKIKAYVRFSKSDSLDLQLTAYSLQLPLKGIPISIKDNICTQGYNTECCSKILAGFKPPYDATVIQRLKQAGAKIMPLKTNMDEFAFGSSTENSCFGPTYNPWDLTCVPGGSSGGSAACLAADEAIAALGSDTGGSIRQPASFCGVVGLKPTYGRVSRYGLIAFASSLDQIGTLTKDVRDSSLLMNVIAGYDPKDSTSVNVKTADYTRALINDIKGLKIGIPKEYFTLSGARQIEGIDREVRDIILEAINQLRNLGAICQEVSLPHTEYAVAVYYIVATAEASSNLARFDGVQYGFRAKNSELRAKSLIDMYKETRGEGFGSEAKRRIILGTYALSHGYYEAYYLRALKVRTLIKRDFDNVFKDFDCIVAPVSPTPAFKIGEKIEDPLKMYLSDIYTISSNLAGIPVISLPCGFTENNLPVGMQILAKQFDEETIFRVAYTYEQNTQWHKIKPEIQ